MKTIIPSTKISISENNVLAVIGDQKLPVLQGGVVVSFEAHVISSQDYSPFGVTLSGRSWSAGCRYGFNGKERDDEGMGGGGNTYDYGFRIYNSNLAKFLSVDPLSASYPWYTPYQFAGNKPIRCIDIDGLEELDYKSFSEAPISGYKLLIEISFPEIIKENDPQNRTQIDGWRISADNQFWSLEGSSYVLKDGVLPSSWLQDMIDNPGNYTVDFAQFVDLQRLYAMRESMWNEEFDRYMNKQPGEIKVKQHGYTGVKQHKSWSRNSANGNLIKGGSFMRRIREASFYNKLPIGSNL